MILVGHKLQGKKKLMIARYDGICGEWYCLLISSTHRSIRLTEGFKLSFFSDSGKESVSGEMMETRVNVVFCAVLLL